MNRPLGHCGAVSRATASSASGSASPARSQAADVLVAGGVPAAAGVRVAPALVLVALDRVGLDRRADVGDDLLGEAAVGRGERLPLALGRVHRLGEGDALDLRGGLVGGEQVGDLALERDRERVLLDRRLVRAVGRRSIVEDGRLAEGRRGRPGDADGVGGDAVGLVRGQDAGCWRSPTRRRPGRGRRSLRSRRSRRPRPRPLLMAIDSSRRRTTRTSAYPAPSWVAVSRARSVRSRMRDGA